MDYNPRFWEPLNRIKGANFVCPKTLAGNLMYLMWVIYWIIFDNTLYTIVYIDDNDLLGSSLIWFPSTEYTNIR